MLKLYICLMEGGENWVHLSQISVSSYSEPLFTDYLFLHSTNTSKFDRDYCIN